VKILRLLLESLIDNVRIEGQEITDVRLVVHWLCLNSLRTDGDFCHKGRTQKMKIVETYWHDHSLESSRGALSYGTN
jgi:hypothetical protein